MAVIQNLDVNIRSDISGFTKSTTKAQKQTKSFTEGITSGAGKATTSLSGLTSSAGGLSSILGGVSASGALAATGIGLVVAGALAAAAAIAALTVVTVKLTKDFAALVREQFSVIDATAKSADRFGVTIRQLEAYKLAASQSGSSAQEFEGALRRLNKRSFDAARGTGEAVKAFKDLGINARDLTKLTTDEKLKLIADRIQGLGDAQAQQRITQQIFGDEAAKLTNLFAGGSDAIKQYEGEVDKLGIALSRSQAAGIEKANDAQEKFTEQLRGFAVQVAAKIAPLVERFFNRLRELAQEFLPAAKQLGNVLFTLGDTIFNVIESIFPLTDTAKSLADGITDALIQVEFFIINFQDIVSLQMDKAMLAIEMFANDVVNFFVDVIPTAFVEFAGVAADVFTGLASNIGNFATAIVNSVKSGFTEFEFVWEPLEAGLQDALKRVGESFERELTPSEIALQASIDAQQATLDKKFEDFAKQRREEIEGAGEALNDVATSTGSFFDNLEDEEVTVKGKVELPKAVEFGSAEAFKIINNARRQQDPSLRVATEHKDIARKQQKALESIDRNIQQNGLGVAALV